MKERDTRSILFAFISYLFLVVLQMVAFAFTHVLALLAQAFEMLSDVLISAFLLVSIFWSRKSADEYHMFGHGRAQNVASLVSATILISFMSVETFREAIPRFFSLPEIEQNTNVAILVTVFGMVVVAFPLVNILRTKEKKGSVKAQFIALLKDEASYVVVLAGIVGVSFGLGWADPLAAVIVGILILLSGVYLFKENVSYLVGKAPEKDVSEKILNAVRKVPGVLGVHDFEAEYVGPGVIHAGFHLEVAKGTSIEEADRISHEAENNVRVETGCRYCTIHVDPKP